MINVEQFTSPTLSDDELQQLAAARFDAMRFAPKKERLTIFEGANAMTQAPMLARIIIEDATPREALYEQLYGTRWPEFEN